MDAEDNTTEEPTLGLVPRKIQNVSDKQIAEDIENGQGYKFKRYTRLYGKRHTIRNVSFEHSTFESCYFNNCVFDSCNFTGCKFIGCNFHQTTFTGCSFKYAIFERCHIDDDILEREAPKEENLRLKFARSLRVNFQQIGDAKAVNKAISLELEATATYLKKSWLSNESYYQKKFPGWRRIFQFFKWLEFALLDVIWGNGESSPKLLRTIVFIHFLITIGDTLAFKNPWNLHDYLDNLLRASGIFFGIISPKEYSTGVLSLIAAIRLICFAFLTAILVKRFGRR